MDHFLYAKESRLKTPLVPTMIVIQDQDNGFHCLNGSLPMLERKWAQYSFALIATIIQDQCDIIAHHYLNRPSIIQEMKHNITFLLPIMTTIKIRTLANLE